MLKQSIETYSLEAAHSAQAARRDRSLAIVLWSLWALAVVGTAYWNWRSDVVAQQPVNMLALVIYSVLAGLVGMLVVTIIEQWLEPLRFLDD